MRSRKSAYTGEESDAKDSIIPKDLLGDEIFNWASNLPSTKKFNNSKQKRLPEELEMQINEVFHFLELSKLRVKYFELIMKKLQEKLKDGKSAEKAQEKRKKSAKKVSRKDTEIEKAIHDVNVVQASDEGLDKILNNRKKTSKLWD